MIAYAPCKDCKERIVGCHATCKKYKKYREQLEQFKKDTRHIPSTLAAARTTHNSLRRLRRRKD